MLARPFGGEEIDNRRATGDEGRAVPPHAVLRVGKRDAFGRAAVPAILGEADFQHRAVMVERRKRGAGHRLFLSGEGSREFDTDTTGHRADEMMRRRAFPDRLGVELAHSPRVVLDAREDGATRIQRGSSEERPGGKEWCTTGK